LENSKESIEIFPNLADLFQIREMIIGVLALERVLLYLKGTISLGIHYTGCPTVLEGYCDANWISDADEIYATSGYVFSLGGGAVS
jgi:hypothetical protein